MEREMQPQSPAHLRNVVESGTSYSPNLYSNPASVLQDQANVGSAGVHGDHSREGQNNPSKSSELQLVLFDPSIIDACETGNPPNPDVGQTPSSRPRGSPQIGAFTVQCANCFKWRIIPTKEKYEEIREHIMEQAFFCERGGEWRPNISCNEPADIAQDGTRVWAIDKPGIARPPPGWQRNLRIRAEGGTKFADVYYVSPTGKRLRSLVEVERFFTEHPEYMAARISLEKFSFQTPRPLQQNYARRRPSHPAHASLDPEAVPLSRASPELNTDEAVSRPSYLGSTSVMPEAESAKRQKTAV